MKLFGLANFGHILTNSQVAQWCGRMVYQKSFVLLHEEVQPLNAASIKLMQVPKRPIIKMSNEYHVDNFFATGKLRLGAYSYFRSFGHKEVGDVLEGQVVLYGQDYLGSAVGRFEDDDRDYIFCTYLGEPDPDIILRFGYDSAFQINDLQAFSDAIQRCLNANKYSFGTCVYGAEKVLKGQLSSHVNFKTINNKLVDMIGEARHFIKPDNFAHQNEFRIVWRMPTLPLKTPLDIVCPEAVKYCSKVSL